MFSHNNVGLKPPKLGKLWWIGCVGGHGSRNRSWVCRVSQVSHEKFPTKIATLTCRDLEGVPRQPAICEPMLWNIAQFLLWESDRFLSWSFACPCAVGYIPPLRGVCPYPTPNCLPSQVNQETLCPAIPIARAATTPWYVVQGNCDCNSLAP